MGQSERVAKLYEEPTILLVGTNRLSDRLYETLQTNGMDVERVSAAVAPAAYRAVVPDLCVIAADGIDERGKKAVLELFDGRSPSITPPVLIEKKNQGIASKLNSPTIATLSSTQPIFSLAKQIRELAVKASETHEQLVHPANPPELPAVSPSFHSIESVVATLDLEEEETAIFDDSRREGKPRFEGSQPLEYQAFKPSHSDGNLDVPRSIELETDELEQLESRIRKRGFRFRLTPLLALIAVGLNRIQARFKTRTLNDTGIRYVSANKRFVAFFRRFLTGTKAELVGILNRSQDYFRNNRGTRQNASIFFREFASKVHVRLVNPLGERLNRLTDSTTHRLKMLSRSNKIIIYVIIASVVAGTLIVVIAVNQSSIPAESSSREQIGRNDEPSLRIENEKETVPSRGKTKTSFRRNDNRKRGSAAKTAVSRVSDESNDVELEGKANSRQPSAFTPAVRRRIGSRGSRSESAGGITHIAKANDFIRKGNRMLQSNRLGIAESYYLKALRTKPKYPRAMASLVKVHLKRKDGREALRWAKRLIKRQPNSSRNRRLLKRAQAISQIKSPNKKIKNTGSAPRRHKTRSFRSSHKKKK